jgi:hypothetical protein
MPVNLRNTLLFAAALRVLGPKHEFTVAVERLLSKVPGHIETVEAALDRLPKSDRSSVLDCYQGILGSLPMNGTIAA